MADHDDSLLRDLFSTYRSNLMEEVQPVGPTAVHATVRRRRRVAATATGVLALALVAGPVVGYAALDRDHAAPPAPADSGAPSLPTPTPTPSASASASPAPPDGRISKVELLKASLTLPPWQPEAPNSCGTKGVRLIDGTGRRVSPPALMALLYADADGDGAQETVTILGCRWGEAALQQVVVFDRDAGGQIVVLGQVIRTGSGFDWITDLRVGAPGTVRIQVGDIQPCCSTPAYWARKQWRTYSWNGSRFTQTDGPTAWGPDTRLTDLSLIAGDLVLGPADASGKRRGSVTFTVANTGPIDAPQLGFRNLESVGTPDGGDWALCRRTSSALPHRPSCMVAGLRVGESRTYTFRFVVTDPGAAGRTPGMVVTVSHYDAQNRIWPDLTYRNNDVTLRVGD